MNRPAHYRMAKRPGFVTVKDRRDFAPVQPISAPEIVTVDRATECHVTPMDVAARMVDYLGEPGDVRTLEPSAGTGNLSRALIGAGYTELVQVERHIRLSQGLDEFGAVINRCFLEYAEEVRGRVKFQRVIMNPPFSDVRKHVRAALSLMGRDGRAAPPVLVALVPITFQHERAEHVETLPSDTFAYARVNTKIIRIRGEE